MRAWGRGRRSYARAMEAIAAGDPDGFRWLWDRFAGEIRGYLQARGTPDVDEVVNDVFLAAFAGVGGFEGDEAAFRAWLFQIARHKRVDAFRRIRRQPTATGETLDAAAGDDVEAEALQIVDDDRLRAVLEGLTPDQRDVIVLRFVSDLSLAQTATALDKPLGAVKALQHRAVAQLRKAVAPDPYPAEHPGPMS